MIKIGDILQGKISVNASGSAYLVSEDLPKDIRWKLFLARQVALAKYREVHGQERA